jgi:hypothetical protein
VLTVIYDNTFVPFQARLLQSDDKGKHWYVRNPNIPFSGNDAIIRFRNHSVGLYKNNGALYRTTDGGTTWNTVAWAGNYFSFCFDNVPGVPGSWVSTGGDDEFPGNAMFGYGSSITYDDGNHWVKLDTGVNHTHVVMVDSQHGFSGGITTGSGHDGVFVYSPCNPHHDFKTAGTNNSENIYSGITVYPNPSYDAFSLNIQLEDFESCFMKVYTMDGQLVSELKLKPNETIRFGEKLIPGIYIAEIIAGNEKEIIRLIKQ